MGLIKEGIKCGTTYAIAKQGLQAYEKHETNKQHPAVLPIAQGQNRAAPVYETSGFVHQTYCNGSCNGQCGGTVTKEVSDSRKGPGPSSQ